MIALLILVSLVCFACLVYINWASGVDLGLSDFVVYAVVAALPIVNIVVLCVNFGDYITKHRAGVVLKGKE
jgi:hypothetical protein